MALSAHALTTVAAVKDELQITVATHDTYIETLINRVSEEIERYCNRHFEKGTAISEKQEGRPGMFLCVDRPPIVTLTSVAYSGSVLDSSAYEIHDNEAGLIYMLSGVLWTAAIGSMAGPVHLPGTERKLYTVVYDGGFILPKDAGPTLPSDLEHACILAATQLYRQRGRDRTVASESLMGYSVSYSSGPTFATLAEVGDSIFNDQVLATLRRYRRVVL